MKIAFALLTLVLATQSAGASAPTVVSYSISPDESNAALLTDQPYRLRIVGEGTDKSVALTEIDDVKDVAPDPRIELAGDGKYLAIVYAASEEETVVEVVDVATLSVIRRMSATSAAWLDEGHTLIVVPLYPLDGTQETPGLIRLDAATGRSDVVAANTFFTGELDAGRHGVLARSVKLEDGLPVFGVTRVDLESGSTATFP
jgi:hypothetical protein